MADSNALILASGSAIRRQLLEAAGIRFEVIPADVDEAACRERDPSARALALALEKAETVSRAVPGRLVLGSDQVFTLDGEPAPKPESDDALLEQLERMNGRTHVFHCGVALVRDASPVASFVEIARVTFHQLGAAELRAYAATREGIGCAGGYRLEEGGVRLIRSIEGSHFTVLGLPMLKLVSTLRELGVAPAVYRDSEEVP